MAALGTMADFRAIWFTDSLNGWIVGGHYNIPRGLIGRTSDGSAAGRRATPR
jgi:hypothetical protein